MDQQRFTQYAPSRPESLNSLAGNRRGTRFCRASSFCLQLVVGRLDQEDRRRA